MEAISQLSNSFVNSVKGYTKDITRDSVANKTAAVGMVIIGLGVLGMFSSIACSNKYLFKGGMATMIAGAASVFIAEALIYSSPRKS